MKDNVLVIIATYNAMRWIDHCVQSTIQSHFPLDLFIIDNSSTDGTVEFIKTKYPSIKIVQNEKNVGFGAANNIGLQYALDHNYSYAYLLNQDAWVKPNTIQLLVEANKAYPQYGILSPIQMQSNEKDLDKNFSLVFPKKKRNAPLVSVKNVMAAHWLISRDCLLDVGGFSSTFHHYGEDDNYCDRALYKGYKIGIVTKALAIHDRGARIATEPQKLYNSYVRTLVYLSGFEKTTAFALYGFLCDCVKYLFKERSLLFIIYIKKLFLNFRLIKKNKKISTCKTAFLHIKD